MSLGSIEFEVDDETRRVTRQICPLVPIALSLFAIRRTDVMERAPLGQRAGHPTWKLVERRSHAA
jgi:hypothetical protein